MTSAARVVGSLVERGLTVAVAESLTGGLVVAELVGVAGASAAVRGGVVAYDTELKHSLLGVDAALLAERGAVDPDVAAAMAEGVRRALRADDADADVGLATTGVAGPSPQDGKAPGTVFVAVSWGDETRVRELALTGDRAAIRSGSVSELLSMLATWLDEARE